MSGPTSQSIPRAAELDRLIARRILNHRNNPGDWLRELARERLALGDISKDHPFALCVVAARRGREDILMILLDEGFAPSPDAHPHSHSSGHSWSELLQECAAYNFPQAIQWLARIVPIDGLDPSGITPLMAAASRGQTKAALLLLGLGADPLARASNGGTPILSAAMGDSPEIIHALLARGADPHALNLDGNSAANIAKMLKKSNFLAILNVLAEARAIESSAAMPLAATLRPRL